MRDRLTTMSKIRVGVSSCLLGETVRYDGGHKRDSFISEVLARHFDLVPFCPEVAIGLGVPRTTIRLIQTSDGIHAINSENPAHNVTEQLRAYADQQRPLHDTLCGYIFKSRSPSCGLEGVKVYEGETVSRQGTGIYTNRLTTNLPDLPVTEESCLADPALRERFIQRVYAYHRRGAPR